MVSSHVKPDGFTVILNLYLLTLKPIATYGMVERGDGKNKRILLLQVHLKTCRARNRKSDGQAFRKVGRTFGDTVHIGT